MIRRTVCLILAAAIAGAAQAHDYRVGDLSILHPVAKPTVATAMTGAGYFTVVNEGETSDTLIGVEADFPRVMMHETVMDGDIATMAPLADATVAPGETMHFAPGGKHVMFMGLNGDPFELGETIPATLIFENAGRVEILFNVEEIADATDHANH